MWLSMLGWNLIYVSKRGPWWHHPPGQQQPSLPKWKSMQSRGGVNECSALCWFLCLDISDFVKILIRSFEYIHIWHLWWQLSNMNMKIHTHTHTHTAQPHHSTIVTLVLDSLIMVQPNKTPCIHTTWQSTYIRCGSHKTHPTPHLWRLAWETSKFGVASHL